MPTNTVTTHAAAIAELEAQGVLEPGTPGWWPVWGARPYDIVAGDIVAVAGGDGWFYVEDTFTAKAAPIRVGIVVDGERQTIGAGCKVVIVRRGTKNTLAASV